MWREQKLLLARYEKENKEISELKHFKWKNLSKLPKDYKNPIEGYDQRIKRYNAIKNRETKPPLGKPSIDRNSKKIANSRLDNSLSTWERMYSYRNKHSNSSWDIRIKKPIEEIEQLVKQSRNCSLNKNNSSSWIVAWERLYENAKKHHEYIENKMKENKTHNINYVNKASQKIIERMEEK